MDGRRDAFDGARVVAASRAPRAAPTPDIRSRDRRRASRARSAAGRRPPVASTVASDDPTVVASSTAQPAPRKPLWTVPGLDPASLWKAIQRDPDPFARDILRDLERAERTEPYLQVGDRWRREPWEVNPYEHIGHGIRRRRDLPEPDASEVCEKLHTTMPRGWTDLPPEPPGAMLNGAKMAAAVDDGDASSAVAPTARLISCSATGAPTTTSGAGTGGASAWRALPTGDWFCDRCVADGRGTNDDAIYGDMGATAMGASADVTEPAR